MLQIGEGILPGGATAVADSILIDVDDIRRTPHHLIGPHVRDSRPVAIPIRDAGIALEVIARQVRCIIRPGIDAR